MKFEWDKKKNVLNLKKHGISFEEAVFVFSDIEAISLLDEDNYDIEERWITIGRIKIHNIIVVVHTVRTHEKKDYIRIISDRKATKNEQNQYFNRIGGT